MASHALFCEVPYLYQTKSAKGWGGVNYSSLLSAVEKHTGVKPTKMVAAVKRGPKQRHFLDALSSNGFKIQQGNQKDRDGEVLPSWDQMCMESVLGLCKKGPDILTLIADFSSNPNLIDVAVFAVENWDTRINLVSIDDDIILNSMDDEVKSMIGCMVVDESLCNR